MRLFSPYKAYRGPQIGKNELKWVKIVPKVIFNLQLNMLKRLYGFIIFTEGQKRIYICMKFNKKIMLL